jgi:hypothetical protein
MLLRASLALGYIPMSWRYVRVVFIPIPGKSPSQASPCGLDRHIRGGGVVEKPLHRNQFAYRASISTETALFQVVYRLEKPFKHKEITLDAFLDIEGAFDNTPFHAVVEAARGGGFEEVCCRWVGSMFDSRLVHNSLVVGSFTARGRLLPHTQAGAGLRTLDAM